MEKDVDFLGFGPDDEETMKTIIRGICEIPVEDGMSLVAAEKLETIVSLGYTNSRMKDYFDLRVLAHEGAIDQTLLAEAIAATFTRRNTALPDGIPLGLSKAFAADERKRTQWDAFLRRNELRSIPLSDVVDEVRAFVAEPVRLAHILLETQ